MINKKSTKSYHISANGTDELNLAEYPLTKLNNNDPRDYIVVEGWKNDVPKPYYYKWSVSGDTLVGFPNEFAERVLMALLAISAHQKFKSRRVKFSIYQVLKIMGLDPHTKQNYGYVENALKQLKGLTIYSDRTFYDKKLSVKLKKSSEGFGVIEYYFLSRQLNLEGIDAPPKYTTSYLIWERHFWSNFKERYIKKLDLEFYYSLPTPLARRMYRFLDKRLWKTDFLEIDLFDFAARLGMAKYPTPSALRRRLMKPLQVLVDQGFLSNFEFPPKSQTNNYSRVRVWKSKAKYKRAKDDQQSKRREPKTHPAEVKWGTTDEHRQLWKKAQQALQGQMTKSTYGLNIATSRLLSLSPEFHTVHLGCNHPETIERLKYHLEETLTHTLAAALDWPSVTIDYINLKDYEQTHSNDNNNPSQTKSQGLSPP